MNVKILIIEEFDGDFRNCTKLCK